jgi:hypothetical protein
MAKATENDAAEMTAALARYIEKLDRDNSVPAELKHLDAVLCTIATDRNLPDPKLQAKVIRYKLVNRIDYCRSSQARFLHYGHFIDEKGDPRLYHLIRLTTNQQKIGQRRGSKSALNRASALEEAKAIKNKSQLTVVERRAFDILKGARPRPRKNLIEVRATQLAKTVKAKWFSPRRQAGRSKGKWTRKPDADARSFQDLKPRLTLTNLVSIAAPVIEEFAGREIAVQDAADATFEALWHIVRAYKTVIIRDTPRRDLPITQNAVWGALIRWRRELKKLAPTANSLD